MMKSPIKQTLGAPDNIDMQNQLSMAAISAGSPAATTPTAINPMGAQPVNPSLMSETPISPKAFSNSKTMGNIYGKPNAGTFTRTVQDGPQLPPKGVQTSVTPTLGFENN